jgi:hypothetical protein
VKDNAMSASKTNANRMNSCVIPVRFQPMIVNAMVVRISLEVTRYDASHRSGSVTGHPGRARAPGAPPNGETMIITRVTDCRNIQTGRFVKAWMVQTPQNVPLYFRTLKAAREWCRAYRIVRGGDA